MGSKINSGLYRTHAMKASTKKRKLGFESSLANERPHKLIRLPALHDCAKYIGWPRRLPVQAFHPLIL